jgi:transposase
MLSSSGINRVYLASGPTDMRRSIDGLAVLVKEGFNLDPFSTSLFVFCNKQRDRLKILKWDHNGFWLYYRRLERGRFQWPSEGSSLVTITYRELRWLLDGLSLSQPRAHQEVKERIVI